MRLLELLLRLLLYLSDQLTDLLVTLHQTVDLNVNTLTHHVLEGRILIGHHCGGTGNNFVCCVEYQLLLGVALGSDCERLSQRSGRSHKHLVEFVLPAICRRHVEQEDPQRVLESVVLQHLDYVAIHNIWEGVLERDLIRSTGTVELLVNVCCRNRQAIVGLVKSGKHLVAPFT
ncbi:hypothetical protein D3C86_1592730 [compost metagenome]